MAAVCKDQRTRINLASRMEKGTVRNVADIKSLLVTHKVNVNARNQLGWSPLMIACAKGCKDMVIFLLDRGADPNARSTQGGNTPMHYACLKNHCGCCSRGNICNYSVRLESHEIEGRIGILRLLIRHGATLHCNSDGLDPPCLAALHKVHLLVDFFVKSTCRLKLSDEEKGRACDIFGVAFSLDNLVDTYDIDCTGDVAPYQYLCRALSIREGSGITLPTDQEKSKIAAHFSLFTTKACKTPRDLKQLKCDPWAEKIQCFLVADKVLPEQMKNTYLFPRLLKHGRDGLFFYGKTKKKRKEASLIFREALQWEIQSKVGPGTVLKMILDGIRLGSPDLHPDIVKECYKLLDLCLREFGEVSKTCLQKANKKLLDDLGFFLYDLALYDFCRSKEMFEWLLQFGERMIRVVRRRCGRNTPSVTHLILGKIDELFWDSKNKGRMKENRVKRLISTVVQCEGASQISDRGKSMLHSSLDVVSYADPIFIRDTSLILVRNGCDLDARNRDGETVREILRDTMFFNPDAPENKELMTIISPATEVLRLEEIAARTILRHKIPHEAILPRHLSLIVRGELEPYSELFPKTYQKSPAGIDYDSDSDKYSDYFDYSDDDEEDFESLDSDEYSDGNEDGSEYADSDKYSDDDEEDLESLDSDGDEGVEYSERSENLSSELEADS